MPYTESKEDALGLLEEVREDHIAAARDIADELIAKHGATHVGMVFATMIQRDLVNLAIPQHWLGAVFRVPSKYKWTGQMVQTEIGHDRLARVWTFRGNE